MLRCLDNLPHLSVFSRSFSCSTKARKTCFVTKVLSNFVYCSNIGALPVWVSPPVLSSGICSSVTIAVNKLHTGILMDTVRVRKAYTYPDLKFAVVADQLGY